MGSSIVSHMLIMLCESLSKSAGIGLRKCGLRK